MRSSEPEAPDACGKRQLRPTLLRELDVSDGGHSLLDCFINGLKVRGVVECWACLEDVKRCWDGQAVLEQDKGLLRVQNI